MPASIASPNVLLQENAPPTNPTERLVTPLRWPWATTRTAVLSGLLRLIPIPFLDDYAVSLQRRHLVKRLLRQNGVTYSNGVPPSLAAWDGPSSRQTILHRSRSLFVKPVTKIFRTVFFWLALRDAGKTAIETYLLGRTVNQLAKTDRVVTESSQLTLYRARRAARAFSVAIHSIDAEQMRRLTVRFWEAIKRHSGRLLRGRLMILPENPRMPERDVIENALEKETPGFIATFETRFEEQFTPSI